MKSESGNVLSRASQGEQKIDLMICSIAFFVRRESCSTALHWFPKCRMAVQINGVVIVKKWLIDDHLVWLLLLHGD